MDGKQEINLEWPKTEKTVHQNLHTQCQSYVQHDGNVIRISIIKVFFLLIEWCCGDQIWVLLGYEKYIYSEPLRQAFEIELPIDNPLYHYSK